LSFDDPHKSTATGAFVNWLALNRLPTVLAFSHFIISSIAALQSFHPAA
jgi:hypothetical protein